MVVCARLGAGVDVHGASPEFLGADARKVDGGASVHAWCHMGAADGL